GDRDAARGVAADDDGAGAVGGGGDVGDAVHDVDLAGAGDADAVLLVVLDDGLVGAIAAVELGGPIGDQHAALGVGGGAGVADGDAGADHAGALQHPHPVLAGVLDGDVADGGLGAGGAHVEHHAVARGVAAAVDGQARPRRRDQRGAGADEAQADVVLGQPPADGPLRGGDLDVGGDLDHRGL